MTLEQRLDAAAEQHRIRVMCIGDDDPGWKDIEERHRRLYRSQIIEVCRAFAPEHFDTSKEETK